MSSNWKPVIPAWPVLLTATGQILSTGSTLGNLLLHAVCNVFYSLKLLYILVRRFEHRNHLRGCGDFLVVPWAGWRGLTKRENHWYRPKYHYLITFGFHLRRIQKCGRCNSFSLQWPRFMEGQLQRQWDRLLRECRWNKRPVPACMCWTSFQIRKLDLIEKWFYPERVVNQNDLV